MLYSILMDYIFIIKNYNKKYNFILAAKDFISTNNFTFFEYFILSFYIYFINIEQFLLNKQLKLVLALNFKTKGSISLKFLNKIVNIINYLKFFLLSFEGFQYSNEMKFIYNFYYIL